MAAIRFIEAVNSPGRVGKSGDDRYGFDAGAGTAWVLDGATDVTDLKPFPRAESGAAWVAQALSDRLMVAPPADLGVRAYWRDVVSDVRQRAERESALPIRSLPAEAWPIASGIWMRRLDGQVELAWVGDCIALALGTGTIHGAADAIERETAESLDMAALSEAERWEAARQSRIAGNSSDRAAFGLVPEKAERLSSETLDVSSGDGFVLMSDGFFRLIEPYRIVEGGPGLAELVREVGLSGAIERLRAFEAETSDAEIPRIKPSDDACALHIEIA